MIQPPILTKFKSTNSPSSGKIRTYLGCIAVIFTTYYVPFQFLRESTTDHRKSKFCDPITQDSPLLSSLKTSHHKNYGNNTHITLSNYWPNRILEKSLLHISIHENHDQLILTSFHYNSRDTHFKRILPRQKIQLLSLKTQFRQSRIFSSHKTEKFINSSPSDFHSSKHLPHHHFITSHRIQEIKREDVENLF